MAGYGICRNFFSEGIRGFFSVAVGESCTLLLHSLDRIYFMNEYVEWRLETAWRGR